MNTSEIKLCPNLHTSFRNKSHWSKKRDRPTVSLHAKSMQKYLKLQAKWDDLEHNLSNLHNIMVRDIINMYV
jgi:hypothetical protein